MALCPQHTFLVLTKRVLRMLEFVKMGNVRGGEWNAHMVLALANQGAPHDVASKLATGAAPSWPLTNVWLGASIEDQKRNDMRTQLLCGIHNARLWLSVEPMLGPVVIRGAHRACMQCTECDAGRLSGCTGGSYRDVLSGGDIKWVVVGCESGAAARHMDLAWALRVRDQCAAAGVPYYLKQITRNGELVKRPVVDGKQHTELPWKEAV